MRQLVDYEALTGATGFYDVIDQLLHDNKLGGIQELCDFYKTDVIRKHGQLMKKARQLNNLVAQYNINQDTVVWDPDVDTKEAFSWNLANLCERKKEESPNWQQQSGSYNNNRRRQQTGGGMSSSSSSSSTSSSVQPATTNQSYINTFRPIDGPTIKEEPIEAPPQKKRFRRDDYDSWG